MVAHCRKILNYEAMKGGRTPSENKFKTQINNTLWWIASDINFKLLHTGCPIAHAPCKNRNYEALIKRPCAKTIDRRFM